MTDSPDAFNEGRKEQQETSAKHEREKRLASPRKKRGRSTENVVKKERVQLDFTEEGLQQLDEMKNLAGATTRAEVIRNALRLYDFFLTEVKPEYTVNIEDNGEKIMNFKAKLLYGRPRSN